MQQLMRAHRVERPKRPGPWAAGLYHVIGITRAQEASQTLYLVAEERWKPRWTCLPHLASSVSFASLVAASQPSWPTCHSLSRTRPEHSRGDGRRRGVAPRRDGHLRHPEAARAQATARASRPTGRGRNRSSGLRPRTEAISSQQVLTGLRLRAARCWPRRPLCPARPTTPRGTSPGTR